MSILTTDLVLYAAANRPEDDAAAGGGAIDPDYRYVFTQLAANDTLQVSSANAGDTTQVVTVTGLKADGASQAGQQH